MAKNTQTAIIPDELVISKILRKALRISFYLLSKADRLYSI